MSEETVKKFIAEDELAQVQSFKKVKNNITFALGENRLYKESLLESYRNVVSQEQDYLNKLSIKYGDGSLDVNTGEIASPSDEQNI
jgi:hypothetical protein